MAASLPACSLAGNDPAQVRAFGEFLRRQFPVVMSSAAHVTDVSYQRPEPWPLVMYTRGLAPSITRMLNAASTLAVDTPCFLVVHRPIPQTVYYLGTCMAYSRRPVIRMTQLRRVDVLEAAATVKRTVDRPDPIVVSGGSVRTWGDPTHKARRSLPAATSLPGTETFREDEEAEAAVLEAVNDLSQLPAPPDVYYLGEDLASALVPVQDAQIQRAPLPVWQLRRELDFFVYVVHMTCTLMCNRAPGVSDRSAAYAAGMRAAQLLAGRLGALGRQALLSAIVMGATRHFDRDELAAVWRAAFRMYQVALGTVFLCDAAACEATVNEAFARVNAAEVPPMDGDTSEIVSYIEYLTRRKTWPVTACMPCAE